MAQARCLRCNAPVIDMTKRMNFGNKKVMMNEYFAQIRKTLPGRGNYLLFLIVFLLLNCQTKKISVTTGIETVDKCKNLVLDETKYNPYTVAQVYEIVATEYFDLGNIFLPNEKEGIYDTTFIESTSLDDIEKYYTKEKRKLNNLDKIEIIGIDKYIQQKKNLLDTRNDLYILIKKSLDDPLLLLKSNLTNSKDLAIIFEKDNKKFDRFFTNYFINLNEYYGQVYLDNLSKTKNKKTELIIFYIFHSIILELNEKERELNTAFYNEYKKIYDCKD